MKVLDLNRRIFTWLNICPTVDDQSHVKKYLRGMIAGTIIVTECLAIVASFMFIHRFLETEIENCLYALFQVAALFSVIYMWTVGFILRNTIAEIFRMFQKIYDSSNHVDLSSLIECAALIVIFLSDTEESLALNMAKADQSSNQITVLLVKYVVLGFICVLAIMGTLNVVYCHIVYGQINEELLYFPYHFV